MKIAFHLPHLTLGGVEVNSIKLANEFIEKGHNVYFIVHRFKGEHLDIVNPKIQVIELKAMSTVSAVPKLSKVLKKESFDLIISSRDLYNSIILLIKKINKINTHVMVTCHTDAIEENKRFKKISRKIKTFLYLKMAKMTYKWADSIIAVSEGVKKSVSTYSGIALDNITTIYNPIIDDDFDIRRKEKIDDMQFDKKIIMSAGRLVEQKNFDLLIDSFYEIVQTRKDLKLVVFGTGEEKSRLLNKIKKLNMSDIVEIRNPVSNLIKYINLCEIFVLPSRWEGFGNVLAEAVGCGVKIISTDCPSGPNEILDNGKYGILIESDNKNEMVKNIIYQLDHEVDRDKIRKGRDRFITKKIAEEYLNVYEKENN